MLDILEQVLDRDMNWEEGRDAIEDAVRRSPHQLRDCSPWGELMLQQDAGEPAPPADGHQAPGAPWTPGLAPGQVRAAPLVAKTVALVEAAGRAAAAATVAAAITPPSAEQKPERSVIERLMHRLGGLFNLGGGLKKSELPQSPPALPGSQSFLARLPRQQDRALLAEQGESRTEAFLARARQAVAAARVIRLDDDPDRPTAPAGPPITLGAMEECEEVMHLMGLAEASSEGLGELVRQDALRYALTTFKKRCRYRELGRDPGRLPDDLMVLAEITPAAAPPGTAGDPGQPPAAGLHTAAAAQALFEDILREAGAGTGLLITAEAGSPPAQAQLQGAPAMGEAEAGAPATASPADASEPEADAHTQLQGWPATGEAEASAEATAPVSDAGRPAPVQLPRGTPADEQGPVTHQEAAAASQARVVVQPPAVLEAPTASDEAAGSPPAAGQQPVPEPAPADAQAALEVEPAVETEPTGDDEPERLPPAAEPQANTVEPDLQPPVSQEIVAGEHTCHVWGSTTHAGLSLDCRSQAQVSTLLQTCGAQSGADGAA